MGCRKCKCKRFRWNPWSTIKTIIDVVRNDDDDRNAMRNCLCGHHINYHDDDDDDDD